MRKPYVRRELEIPSGVKVTIESRRIRVEGPLGRVEKDMSHIKSIEVYLEGSKIVIETFMAEKKTYSMINLLYSLINNMIEGVQKGYRYKMKVVYAHFPMNVKVDEKNGVVIIENFLGRRGRVTAHIMPGVKVKAEKDEVIIEGIDKEAVAQTAANIRDAVRLRGKYRMSPHGREGGPGILDGIYVYAREHLK
ncbi:MAG: 50S ribosomal protein L6 [Thermofilaceae archaeon]